METGLRIPIDRGRELTIYVDGQPVRAYAGETIATVLMANGQRTFRHTTPGHSPRGLFCGMGVCFDCLVTVDTVPNIRACVTQVQDGMRIATQEVAHA